MHILVTQEMIKYRTEALRLLYHLRSLLEGKAATEDAHYITKRMVPLNRVDEAIRALERWDTVDDEDVNGPN